MTAIDLAAGSAAASPRPPAASKEKDAAVHKAFNTFVGETFYGQMLQAMRKSVGQAAYFHGGQAEEIFTQQLDQILASTLAETSADKLSDPMYQLFMVGRK